MRRRAIVLVLVLCATSRAHAQQASSRAVRADGSAVILYPNGTWRPDTAPSTVAATANVKEYTMPAADSSALDLGHGVKLHYNPAKWQQGAPSTIPGRQQLRHLSGDGYAMTISERIAVPMASLKKIVLTNARNAAPDAAITFDETRRVNGATVEAMQLTGTTQGIPFRYYGYYFSGTTGTVQIICYTGESLFPDYKVDFEELLNGLQVADK